MSAQILRFPASRSAIWVTRSRDDAGAWLTLYGSHGWLCGSSAEAQVEAEWLSGNTGLPIRETSTSSS